MSPFYVLLIILAVIVLWVVMVYNGLITKRNRTDEAWSDIDVQLKRRYDLIPNLVESVKGYARHESQVFEKVTQARAAAMGAQSMAEHAQAENMLSQTLKSLFAVAEAYPDLKANQNFLDLQNELTDAEDKIQAARRFYNANVRDFNTALQVFPSSIVGNAFSFKSREFFELANEAERATPKVSF
ncbi:LemA family protein [Patescibacteria group bacterium]|nr:MAG: LemA family protein [Patescibacteria group bacterium]